jgi:hypothetical protein
MPCLVDSDRQDPLGGRQAVDEAARSVHEHRSGAWRYEERLKLQACGGRRPPRPRPLKREREGLRALPCEALQLSGDVCPPTVTAE